MKYHSSIPPTQLKVQITCTCSMVCLCRRLPPHLMTFHPAAETVPAAEQPPDLHSCNFISFSAIQKITQEKVRLQGNLWKWWQWNTSFGQPFLSSHYFKVELLLKSPLTGIPTVSKPNPFTAVDLESKKLKWQKISSPPPCLVSVLSKHKIAFKSGFLQTMQLFAFFGEAKKPFP